LRSQSTVAQGSVLKETKKSTSDFSNVELTSDHNEPIGDFIGTFGVDFTACS